MNPRGKVYGGQPARGPLGYYLARVERGQRDAGLDLLVFMSLSREQRARVRADAQNHSSARALPAIIAAGIRG